MERIRIGGEGGEQRDKVGEGGEQRDKGGEKEREKETNKKTDRNRNKAIGGVTEEIKPRDIF